MSATLETDPTDAPPPSGEQFNSMADKLKKAMGTFTPPPEPQAKPELKTDPVEPPVIKKEKVEPKKAEPAKSEPPKDQKPASDPAKPAEDADPVNPKPDDWKALKAKRDEWKTKYEAAAKYEQQAREYEAQLKELKTKAPATEEVENIKKSKAELEARLERVALEHSEKFKSYYDSKFEAAVNQALDAVGKTKADQIKVILEAPKSEWRKKALNEIIGVMETDLDRLSLISAVTEYDKTRAEREKQLADHKNNLARLREVEMQKAKEAEEKRVEHLRYLVKKHTKEAAEAYESFREIEGNDEQNAAVAKNRETLKKFIMGDMEDKDAIQLPMKAMEYEHLSKRVPELEAKVKELEQAVTKYKAASPVPGDAPRPSAKDGKVTGFKEAFFQHSPK